MIVERSHSRVAPRTFRGFSVQASVDERYFAAELGNISENGLCLLIPGRVKVREHDNIEGLVQASHLNVRLEFNGRVAWTAVATRSSRDLTLIGVEFSEEIELPTSLIALGMAADEFDV